MSQFLVQGPNKLSGEVTVSGSKNAALPILAATLLTQDTCVLENVPDISDIRSFLKILETLGAEVSFESGIVKVRAAEVSPTHIDDRLVGHMRASILLLGPLLGRFKEVELAFPGGCVLGKRSIHAHLHALQALGAEIVENNDHIHLKTTALKAAKVIMAEASVTATENLLMAAIMTPGVTEVRWAAMEPHVQDLCRFLVTMGATIEGIGTHTLTITGGKPLHGGHYRITPDYLEAGTLVLAAVLSKGEVSVKDCPVDQLDSFWQKLEEVGVRFTLEKEAIHIHPQGKFHAIEKLQTSVYPGFPTDLQAPFAVLLTQCQGQSHIYETLFEGRLNYLAELERMGAKVEALNLHQAVIKGPSILKGTSIKSCDIRAGAAMVLAALIAEGPSTISEINYIDRGYERLDEKLRSLGAKIERIQE